MDNKNDLTKAMNTVDAGIASELGNQQARTPMTPHPAPPVRTSLNPLSSAQAATQAPYGSTTGYEHLQRILALALVQAAHEKGKERHSVGFAGVRAWDKQPILEISRMSGPGGAAYQVMKKAQEAVTMVGKGNFAAAKAEVLGAIVYAAALHKLLEEMEAAV